MPRRSHPHTPDGRYFVAKSRLWRCTDPRLSDTLRRAAVKALMQARRDVMLATRANDGAGDPAALADARTRVDAAKHALGERGPVWWADTDDAPDQTGLHPKNSTYAAWWAALTDAERAAGE